MKTKMIISLIIALTVVLVNLFGCWVVLYSKAISKPFHYLGKNITFNIENAKMEKEQIVFVGDSITEFCNLEVYSSQNKIYNRGIAGDSVWGLTKRLKTSVIDLKPKKVVLLIGVNTILRSKQSVKEISSSYENLVKNLTENLPSCEIIIQSIYPVGENYKQFNTTIKELNVEIEKISSKYFCTYVDIFSILVDGQGKLIADYTLDDIHLTTLGYSKVINRLTPYI